MMDEVEQRILKFVLEEYGGWSEDGLAYFKMQVKAYRALEAFCPPDIPPATLRGIKRRAAAVDGDDYVGRQRTVERQVEAYRLLQSVEDRDVPPKLRKLIRQGARLATGSRTDYRTLNMLYRQQIDGYKKLQQLQNSGLPQKELEAAMQSARSNHPGDFARQYEEICRQLGEFGKR